MSAAHQILPVATTAQTRRALWRLLARRRGLLACTALTLLAASVAGLATPALLGYMVDVVAGSADGPGAGGTGGAAGDATGRLVGAAAALLGAGALAAGLGYLGQSLLARVCEGALAELREDVLTTAVGLPLEQVEAAGTGDVVARVSGDVEAVSEAISGVLPAVTSAAFTILLTLVGLGAIDWRFAVAALVAAPVQVLSLRWFLRRSGPVYRAVRVAEAQRTEQVVETVASATTVQALGHADHHQERVALASREAIRPTITGISLLTRFYNRLNMAELVGLAAVLGVGYWLVTTGTVQVGAATAAALYFHRLFGPVGTVLGEFDEMQKAGAGLARLFGITQLRPTGAGTPATRPTRAPTAVVLDEVTFRYPTGRTAVEQVSLRVGPGEHVALVGASGAGKTSVAKLVRGVHAPTSGAVRVDPDRVAMVSQEVHVFSGTLAEDLRLAAPGASAERLHAALRRVGARWVDDLDDGLDTPVGAGGHTLTPERAQQVALARVLLADPDVVVLDEATAEVGSTAAGQLDAAAREVLAGRTALVVAHRLTQAAGADRVVVMDSGRVVESGPHDELRRGQGPYARLWAAWDHGGRAG